MKTPEVSIVCAMDEDRGIGRDGQLLWHIPEDLKKFKETTLGHPVIMGRKTHESIGRVLPERTNIMIIGNRDCKVDGLLVAHSLEEALILASFAEGGDKAFIIGGAQIFAQSIRMVDKLYLTLVEGRYGADVFFPEYPEFSKIVSEEYGRSNGYEYKFLELIKNHGG